MRNVGWNRSGNGNVRRRSQGFHYFFVKPGRNRDAHAVARRLISIGKVREVTITEGEYGFVVKADEDGDGGAVAERIGRASKGSAVKALCHCIYVK